MGEICKGPQNEPQAATIAGSTEIIRFLIRAEGAAAILRRFQYALEALAAEAEQSPPGIDRNTAARYMRAAEELEEPYQLIKNEIKV
jgi:hypothetical protein